jgi:hypothetical protein
LAINCKKKQKIKIPLVTALMLLSVAIKYATLVLIPFIFYIVCKDKITKLRLGKLNKYQLKFDKYFFDLMSLAMFIPLFTERSQQFLPWYLSWSFIFAPFVKNKLWRNLLIVFSFSSLLRYAPWFYYIPWMSFDLNTSHLLTWQISITWLIPVFYLLLSGVVFLFNRRREK